jgi:hypothetical protein
VLIEYLKDEVVADEDEVVVYHEHQHIHILGTQETGETVVSHVDEVHSLVNLGA